MAKMCGLNFARPRAAKTGCRHWRRISRPNVDVITTHGGALVARAAKNAAPATPIVFETGIDPVAAELVAGMARPGGNLTGVSILTSELNAKRFELLAEMVPQVRTFAILVNPRNASAERVVAQLQPAAEARGL